MNGKLQAAIFIAIFLITGTANQILSKAALTVTAPNFYGIETAFEKPWFLNWLMFVGMVTVFIPEFFRKMFFDKSKSEAPKSAKPGKRDMTWLIVLIPATCDTVATVMMNAALVIIPASISQMLRGSIIIFTALLTLFYRHRKLYAQQWLGIILVVISLAMIGITTIFSDNGSHVTIVDLLVGLILMIVSQAIQAFQTILEEELLQDSTVPAMEIVGWEGFWGFCLCSFLSMPAATFIPTAPGNGLNEDTPDSFVMVSQSTVLLILCIGYTISICLFNIFGMFITDVTSALTRNILEPVRTICVWVVSLVIHYASGHSHSSVGEAWTNWSFLQLGAFIIMTVGVLAYNLIIRFPCFAPIPVADFEPEETPSTNSEEKPLIDETQ